MTIDSRAVFNQSKIQLKGLTSNSVSTSGLQISAVTEALRELGFGALLPKLVVLLPAIIQGNIQSSASGVIQDPTGSAIGARVKPSQSGAGGASAAIYSKFLDLDPIPAIPQGASVFNTSTGPGKRVLHTYSPTFGGSPSTVEDCQTAVEQLANAYANALAACISAASPQGHLPGISPVNLIPISGRIFAGQFKDPALNHLHPSYSLTAIAIAQAELMRLNQTLLPITLYYHDSGVFTCAQQVVGAINVDD